MARKSSKPPAQVGPDTETDPVSTATATPNNIPPESRDASSSNARNGPPPALQPMRLKVLYSIDDLLPNCLARAKEVVHVRVAHLDENTPIGFVDLKTCVLNIVYSSPEIMHHQGCDYSVYTYDYSEPDNPLTGLGLLSWVLSLPTLNGQQPDPDAIDPAQANRLVTGRVQKNLLGLFAGDVKETLEVRMRLCRVPTLRQVDYLNHMNQYSQLSQSIPPGVDPASVWTNGVMGQSGMGGQFAQQQQQQHGGPGGMAYPYAPQGVGSYQPMGQYQPPPPGHMNQPPQGYPQHYPQNLQPPFQSQPPAPLQQSHGTQAPSPANTQLQSTQLPDMPEGGAPTAPSIADGGPSPAPSSQAQQAVETPAPAIGSEEQQKAEPNADPTQPAAKKRRVSTKKPTGKPRGRPRLTDPKKSNTDVQPSSREGLPQDPAATDAAPGTTIKQAPTPSSVAPSPSLTSVSASNLNHTSTLNTLPPDSNAGSPHPSLSQATPLPPPSSAAPSPATLIAVVSEAGDMTTRLNTMSPLNEDRDVEMTQDGYNDADTEVADSPRDSEIDSLFIGSSPPPSHSEAAENDEASPPLDTSPVLPRQPSKGFFPSQPRQSSFSLQEAIEASEDELALPSGGGGLLFPTVKPSEKQEDKESPSEKAESPKDSPKDSPKETDESTSSTSQVVLPRKRGRPPKNPDLKTDTSKKPKEKKSGVKTDPLPSDAPIPTSPVEQKPENKPKSKKSSSVPMLAVPTTNLPSGLILPTPMPKENENSRKRRASDAGSDNDAAPAKRGSTTALVRARIERQMLEKIAAGEMPTYCMHCGAIETPTWRKAKVVLTDPESGGEVEREVTLCNPCGLWHHNHGTMRPDQYWDKKEGEDKPPKPKKKKQKKRVCLAPEGSLIVSNAVVTHHQPCPSSPPTRSIGGHRATSPAGPNKDDEWDQAVNKNLRRIQSSPCGLGTISEPISLLSPDQKTRRKLFPEAKKSHTGLDGAPTPGTEAGSETQDPKAESMSPISPEEPIGSPEMEKENNPPPVDTAVMELDWERELERTLMQANADTEILETPNEGSEDAEDQSPDDDESTPRPRTPANQMTPAIPEFKTPIRLTPLLASINVDSPSFWKSGMLGVATPSGKLISGHPTPTTSKLLMNMNMNTVSPATGEIMLEFLNEWNKAEESMRVTSPTPVNGVDDDNDDTFFSEINMQAVEQEMGLTSEGNAMPSSPPAMFNLYDEEPVSLADGISSSLFSDVLPTSPGNATTYTLDVGEGATDKEVTEKVDVEAIDLNFDFGDALVVDFSDLVPSGAAAKVAAIASANAALGCTTEAAAVIASEKKESSEDDSSSSEGKKG
ncbi:hypothetical protein TWF481_004231 [Arthrobotrys musiformis]|uniref:GATA-type domain-containing protein n=1 Tax=Arthrobotrys musiformis TaxID=47236 RepID=A0AAV9WPN7_9PEZI